MGSGCSGVVWFLEDVRRDRFGDRPVVIGGVGGREVAYCQEVGGVGIAAPDGGSLADAVRDARPADESVWTAEKGRATAPGTVDQSVTATTQ